MPNTMEQGFRQDAADEHKDTVDKLDQMEFDKEVKELTEFKEQAEKDIAELEAQIEEFCAEEEAQEDDKK